MAGVHAHALEADRPDVALTVVPLLLPGNLKSGARGRRVSSRGGSRGARRRARVRSYLAEVQGLHAAEHDGELGAAAGVCRHRDEHLGVSGVALLLL